MGWSWRILKILKRKALKKVPFFGRLPGLLGAYHWLPWSLLLHFEMQWGSFTKLLACGVSCCWLKLLTSFLSKGVWHGCLAKSQVRIGSWSFVFDMLIPQEVERSVKSVQLWPKASDPKRRPLASLSFLADLYAQVCWILLAGWVATILGPAYSNLSEFSIHSILAITQWRQWPQGEEVPPLPSVLVLMAPKCCLSQKFRAQNGQWLELCPPWCPMVSAVLVTTTEICTKPMGW